MRRGESAAVTVALPVHVAIPGRSAVPVEVRDERGERCGRIPADARYHAVPAGSISLRAVLPGGAAYEVSGFVPEGGRARMTLRGRAGPTTARPPARIALEHDRNYVRFLRQTSLDDYHDAPRRSILRTVRAGVTDLALRVGETEQGVTFVQMVTGKGSPVNVAFAGAAGVRLVPVDRRVAPEPALADGRVDLALRYLEESRFDDAVAVIDHRTDGERPSSCEGDAIAALVRLHVDLAAGRIKALPAEADRLMARFPRIPDFVILRAELAAIAEEHGTALELLACLRSLGLPVLHRSYVIAAMRMAGYEADGFAGAHGTTLEDARSVARRLTKLAGLTDPTSALLVMYGTDPSRPSAQLPWWRQARLYVQRLAYPYRMEPLETETTTKTEVTGMAGTTETDQAKAGEKGVVGLARRTTPALAGLAVLIVALLATTVVLLVAIERDEVPWTRMAWLFASFQAVALVGIGMYIGAAPFRRWAERAEAEAEANRRDASLGRALAAAILADDPGVVQEDGEVEYTKADQTIARHVRMARQLYG